MPEQPAAFEPVVRPVEDGAAHSHGDQRWVAAGVEGAEPLHRHHAPQRLKHALGMRRRQHAGAQHVEGEARQRCKNARARACQEAFISVVLLCAPVHEEAQEGVKGEVVDGLEWRRANYVQRIAFPKPP